MRDLIELILGIIIVIVLWKNADKVMEIANDVFNILYGIAVQIIQNLK